MELIDAWGSFYAWDTGVWGAMVDPDCYTPYAWDTRALPCLVFLIKSFQILYSTSKCINESLPWKDVVKVVGRWRLPNQTQPVDHFMVNRLL